MIDIISFVFFKLVASLAMMLVWGWPIFIGWFCWISAHYELDGFWEKFWKGVVVSMCVLGIPTYWNAIWPEPLQPGRPFDALYHFTIRGYNEQLLKNEAEKPPVKSYTGTEIRRYRLDDWNPPKHFYVDITDLTTNQKFDNLYVSKHCSGASALKRGDEYNITLNKYQLSNRPGETFYEFTSLSAVFC